MKVTKISERNFAEEVLQAKETVLIDFYADWCGPCKMLSPLVDKIAEEYPDVKVCKVNVDEENALAAKFGIMSIPKLVVMQNGKIVNSSLGYQPYDSLKSLLKV